MKKLLLAAFFLLSSLGLHAQTTPVTGNLRTVLGEALGSNTFIRIRLRNYKPNRPLVEGVGIIGQTTKDVSPDSNGLISTTVYDNDFIDPTNTFYTLEFYLQGRFVFAASYEITGSTFDFNTANPISTVPTAAIPTLESRVFTHIQSSAATTWTIVHSFGVREVTLDFYDNSFNRIFPDLVTLTDINTVTAKWVVAQAGRAVVMRAENVSLSSSTGDFVLKTPRTAQSITGGFDLTLDGNFLLSLTGQNIGSATVRPDAFLETVTAGVLNNIRIVDGNKYAQTAAGIQAAIDDTNAAGGGEVWIPSSTIPLGTTGLTMKAGVTLRGAGANATFLISTLTSGVVISGGTVVQLRIIGLRIDGLDTSGTAIGIDIPDSINFLVRDVFIEDMGGVGIQVDTSGGGNSNLGTFDNVQSDSNGSDGFFLTGPNSNAITFTGMTSARSNDGWGFNIEGNGNILDVHGDGNNGGSNTEMRIEGDGNIGRAWLEGNEGGNLTFTANSVGNRIETLSLMLSGGLTDDGTDNIVYYSRNGVASFTRINASASGGNSSFISNAPQVAFIGNATRAGRILFTSNNTGVSTGDKLFGGCNDPGDDLCVFNDAGAEIWRLSDAGFLTIDSGAVINLDGDDADTRIEGVGDAQLLYVDASTDRVGIGDASPDSKFDVNGVSEGQRFKAAGTALVAGDIAISTTGAWGDTSDATVGSVTGNDQWFQWTITAGGANTGANPTIVVTFTDGTWTNAPIVLCNRQDFNAPATVTVTVTTATATVLTLTFDGTPTATNTYKFACHVGGV